MVGAARNRSDRGDSLVQDNVLLISTPITGRILCFIMFTSFPNWGVVLHRTQLHPEEVRRRGVVSGGYKRKPAKSRCLVVEDTLDSFNDKKTGRVRGSKRLYQDSRRAGDICLLP